MRLTTTTHDREVAGLNYVYPVVSRRAGGVSVGINLNPNNACNWRCVYCQVPNLSSGVGPPIDLDVLRQELDGLLGEIITGDYMERHVPPEARRLNDIAFSGNGEPTSSPQFVEAIQTVREVMDARGILGGVRQVLITNGSLTHTPEVQEGLRLLATGGGEIWFKLDRATRGGQMRVNSTRAGVERTRTNLRIAAGLCPTWLQAIAFSRDGEEPRESEQRAWLDFVGDELGQGLELKGVQLYGLARESHQPEAAELKVLPVEWLETFADRIRDLGLEVRVTP